MLNARRAAQITGGNARGKTILPPPTGPNFAPDAGDVPLARAAPVSGARDSYHQNLLWIAHQPGIAKPG